MRRWFMLLVLGLCDSQPAAAADRDPVFDVPALSATPLDARTLKTAVKDGIVTEEVRFHAEMDGDQRVDIFAFFSYPQGARRLPAFIWNQGGLAQASTYWTEFGARRGYATLCIDFPLPGYRSTGGYPINSGLELGDDPRKAPIYHGAVALLKAVSYLESRPEVDRDRIGMAGSSWGGFYTTLMVGLDPRLKVGSCMFGCGSLQLGNSWWDGSGRNPRRDDAFRERWRTTLDPAWRLGSRATPIAWFTGTNDSFYWLPAVMRSHELAAGPKHLSLLPNWNHALTPQLDEQVFAWLDVHLKGAAGFLAVTPLEIVRDNGRTLARWSFRGPRKARTAELHLSHGAAGNWHGRYWTTIRAIVKDQRCEVVLPASSLPYHLTGTIIDHEGFRYSTPLLLVDVAKAGLHDPRATPDYDGCAEWGGFEEAQVNGYLKLHGLPVPPLSRDAREGQQSALLKPGATTLPPILCTTELPHRLRLFARAEKPTEMTLRLSGRGDGAPIMKDWSIKVGTEWMQVELDYVPPRALALTLQAVVTVPAGGSVQLDAVCFEPKPRDGPARTSPAP
jgi:dienelactone hydrolase